MGRECAVAQLVEAQAEKVVGSIGSGVFDILH